MTVFFVYRSHYDLPLTKHVKRFDEPNVVSWFQNHWGFSGSIEQAQAHTRALLGCDPHGFAHFQKGIVEEEIPPPRNAAKFREALSSAWCVEGDLLVEPHAVQVLDDDDELQMAYYIFDDQFQAKHPDRTAWLAHEDWELPAGAGRSFKPRVRTEARLPAGRWEGTLYSVFLMYYDSYSMEDAVGAERIDGVRLPQLARYLAEAEVDANESEWTREWVDLQASLLKPTRNLEPIEKTFLSDIHKQPREDTPWNVYGDWLEEHGRKRTEWTVLERGLAQVGNMPAGKYSAELRPRRRKCLSRWHVADHVAQISLHTASIDKHEMYGFWVLFDDLWAGAHPDLAANLLHMLDRWDVLSSPRRLREDDKVTG
jgi:uncharacterized protein (TIGR02996 family)